MELFSVMFSIYIVHLCEGYFLLILYPATSLNPAELDH